MKPFFTRIIHLLSHVVLIGFLLSVLMSALLTVSFSYFLPRVDRYRVELLDWLNQQTPNAQVSAERISGHWEAFRPSLQLYNVKVKNAAWESDLTFSRLTVQFDVLRSLKYEKAIFSHVEISDLSFTLAQNARGEWQLSTDNVQSSESSDIKSIVRSLWGIDNLKVDDLRLRLKPFQRRVVDLPPLEVQGVNANKQRRLLVNLKDDNKKINILTANAWGEPFSDTFETQGYLHIKQYKSFDFLCLLQKDSVIQKANLDIKLWFDWRDQELDVVSDLDLKDVLFHFTSNEVKQGKQRFTLDQLKAKARFTYKDNVAALWVPEISLSANNETLSVKQLHIQKDTDLTIYLKSLHLDQLSIVADWHVLPVVLDETLTTLSPQGYIRDITLTFKEEGDFRLVGNLEKVSVDAWRGAPQLTSVTGRLDTHKKHGHLDFKSHDLSTHFPQIYTRRQDFDYAQGRVSWALDDDWISVAGENISINSVYGDAEGEFYVQIPMSEAMKVEEPARLIIDLDLHHGSAEHRADLIPDKKLPEDLMQWLDESILSAQINNAKFIFHGPLGDVDDQPDEKMAIQLWLDIEEGQLRYSPELPKLSGINGELLLDDTDVFAAVNTAKTAGVNIEEGQFSLVDVDEKHALTVNAQISGVADKAHEFLQLPLIADAANKLFDTLVFNKGKFEGNLTLSSTLSDFEKDLDLTVDVGLDAFNLLFPEQNILIENIAGKLSFSLSEGLNSDGLIGSIFNKPIQANSQTDKKHVTHVDFKTTLSIADVNTWQHQPALTFFSGSADVLGALTFDSASAAIALKSNLKGVSSSLPPPFNKKKETATSMALHFPLVGEKQVLTIDYGQRATLHFLFENDQMTAGELNFSEEPKGFIHQVMRVGGALDSADLIPWLSAFDQLDEAIKKDSATSNTLSWQVKLDPLRIGALRIEGCELADIELFGESYPGFWHINFQQSFIEGGLDFYEDKLKPLSVFVKTLNVDELLKSTTSDVQKTPVDVSNFFAMDVVIDHVIYQKKDFGFWQFKTYVEKPSNTLVYTDIVAKNGDQMIGFFDDGTPSELRWNPLGDVTKVSGKMSGKNFSDVLMMLGFGQEITSKEFSVQGRAEWPGSPSDFSFNAVNGDLSFNFKEGNFTEIETSSSQAIKVIGIFNISYILKRLKLDFSDLTKKGFAFDRVKGRVGLEQGVIETRGAVSVRSPSSDVRINGLANLNDESLDLDMSVSLALASNIPWIATLAVTGAVGLWPAAGVFLVSHLFKSQVNKLSTFVYHIKGSLSEPTIRFKKLFAAESKDKNKKNRKMQEGK